ncbi:hypothetical protein ACVIGA_004610 [Bradyrhizobium sp. USDA 3240]
MARCHHRGAVGCDRRRRLPLLHQAGDIGDEACGRGKLHAGTRAPGIGFTGTVGRTVAISVDSAGCQACVAADAGCIGILAVAIDHIRRQARRDIIPFVSDRTRVALAIEYLPAGDSKALAININGFSGWSVAQPNADAAKASALEQCQKRADNVGSPRKCELYAVGNTIVYAHGLPPVPPLPWVKRDALVEKPYATKDVPLLREAAKARLDSLFVPGRKTRTIALGPGGHFFFNSGIDSLEESARRNLQGCGAVAGVPCTIVVVDDVFVVPVPSTLRVTGFFKAADSSVIVPGERSDVARKLAEATAGWNAVAVGTQGRPGFGLKAENEQGAINTALGDCAKRDSDCHVIAVGPFTVGPN